MLMEGGFDGYLVDFRNATQSFYLPDGNCHVIETHRTLNSMAESFDSAVVKQAILEAQTKALGYTYKGFCSKVVEAGCAGYLVSFPGKRVLYFGSSGETHTEFFPGTGAEGR
jgi:uncharacterized protein YbcV (DUF1398 family)